MKLTDAENKFPLTADELCHLGNKFVETKSYDEAIKIYESALRLYPDNVALKINLGRAKNLAKQKLAKPGDFIGTAGTQEKQDKMFYRCQGLGEVYSKIGKIISAKKIFEVTKLSNPDFYLPYLNLAKLYFEEKAYKKAIAELEVCVKHNPFHEEAYNYLSIAYYNNGEFHKALIAMIDALLLSGDLVKDIPTSYQQKINLIVEKIEGFTPQMRNQLVKTRKEKLQSLYEDLEGDIKEMMRETSDIIFTSNEERVLKEEDKNLFDLALELKEQVLFKSLDDDSLIKIAGITQKHHFLKDDFVYAEDTEVLGLYIIKSGKVEIRKKTPMGYVELALFGKGSFFGEHDLITGKKHWNDAVALDESELFILEKSKMPHFFAKEKTIAIHLLWYFWKSLSFQIRNSNNKIEEFFDSLSPKTLKHRAINDSRKRMTLIETNKKLEALEGKGLSPMEMRLLAAFSDSVEYSKGDYIFREGRPGEKLYVIVEGEVLISKTIPGIGEEALAVLKRGDFFGEMALLGDDNRRSADAKAHSPKVRLIGIKKEALKEILSIDSDSAYQFLSILCRILSFRLREIHEKIYQWKMMEGQF